MARARNIKPGFFKNEDLAECTPWARLCFIGLWTLADREGRLEDRPRRIKGELFAFDSVEVDPLLVELEKHGFIARYTVDGLGIIQIINFGKHQNPHHREPKSDLPPPQSLGLDPVGNPPEPRALDPCNDPKARGKPEASPRLSPDESAKDGGETVLIPDSGFRSRERASPRGSRLPLDELPDEWRAFCQVERPDLNPEVTFAKFADHWRSQPGAKGRKSDWLATWRNWVRNERAPLRAVAGGNAEPWAGAI